MADAMRQLFGLNGKVALVTGSSRGIGRAMALALADAGADVAIHCAMRSIDAEEVVAEIISKGRRSAAFGANFAEKDAAQQLIAEVVHCFEHIDILILNGSTEIRGDWRSVSREEFDIQVAVNLQSTVMLLQGTVPAMVERGWGRVVSIGSIQEAKPNPRLMVYAALKAAQTNIIVNLARELSGTGVTFNNLAPGAIATERNAAVLSDASYAKAVTSSIPAARIGRPEDCAGACVMLCSDAGSYITGASLYVDGGWHRA